MRIINNEHLVLHKEAQEVLEQAEKVGWEEAFIVPIENWNHPVIGLWSQDFDTPSLSVKTQPDFVSQTYRFDDGRSFSFEYNCTILSPKQLEKIIKVIK